MSTPDTRRAELQRRCQSERNQFIAAAANTAARLPDTRQVARWIRLARRILGVLRMSRSRQPASAA